MNIIGTAFVGRIVSYINDGISVASTKIAMRKFFKAFGIITDKQFYFSIIDHDLIIGPVKTKVRDI